MAEKELRCGSCDKAVDSTVSGFEVVLRVGVAIVFTKETVEGVEIEDRTYRICSACALDGRVPYFDGEFFKTMLKASKGN